MNENKIMASYAPRNLRSHPDLAHAAPPSVSHAACNVSTAPLWQPTAILSPADAHDDTGRAEEGGQHLFLAVSTAIRTHAGVVDEFEVIFLGYDVTPNAATSYLRAPVAKSHKNVCRPSAETSFAVCETSVAPSCENSTLMTGRLRRFSEQTSQSCHAPIFSHALSVLCASPPLPVSGRGKTVTLTVLPT